MVESRFYSLSSSLPCNQNGSILPCTFGEAWLHKHRLVPSIYHQCVKGRLNGKMIRVAANPSPFEQTEVHLVETMFYDQWAPSGENVVAKPRGTFVPRWKDVQDDPEPDLRELLARKKKRKEAPAVELDEVQIGRAHV